MSTEVQEVQLESEREMSTEVQEVQLEPIPNKADYEKAQCIFGRANRPVILKFEDVVYQIKINNNNNYFSRCQTLEIKKKTILKRITGAVLPGEMLAMLGPSGSGKTTLLTALGGRLGGKLSGTITYNSRPFSNAIKRNTGFVTQDDVHFPHLIVTETLVYSALLRLPNSLAREEKENQAKAVIAQLGLSKCKDIIIG